MNPETRSAWLALSRTPGLGGRDVVDLLARFGTLETILAARRAELAEVLPEKTQTVAAILAGIDTGQTDAELRWLEIPGNHLVTLDDADYPPLLREIADPPICLFVRGVRALLLQPQFAIVGSRNPTPGGRLNAEAFGEALARAGLVVTSGLAMGIDGCAHRAALAAGGATVAVAATGLDRVYPSDHHELAHRIAEHGALVSESPLGTPPRRENFPQRNRLISGLSLGVLVVEAALKSGSLITARLAAEQGREVFAIPGSIHSPLARGCHRLIRQGAKLVETAQDILEELAPLAQAAQERAGSGAGARPAGLEPALAGLLDQLGYDPVAPDTLVERTGLTAEAVSSMLLQMELRGLIAACPGGRYQRIC
ncbi:MAG: DNA-protecting protein DprA [Gammaproteobacteria bacterium]|nr:DNA-protecting protein DprA [Gammaproteobacteria bacterium]